MPARSEFGGLDRLIREAIAAPASGRRVSFGTLVRTSYGSLAGRSLVGIGFVIGGAFVVLALLASGQDPGLLPFAAAGVVLAVFLVVVPVFPARRAWAAIRDGVLARAVVTEVTYHGPGDATTIDSIKNGFLRGRLRLSNGVEEYPFESDAPWAGEVRVGSPLSVAVHRENGRLLTILGPATGTIPRQ